MTDQQLLKLADGCETAKEFVRRLGHKSHSTFTKCYRERLKKLGVKFKRVQYRHTDEEFREAADGARSISEVAKRLGLRSVGGGWKGCKKRLERLGIALVTMRAPNGPGDFSRKPVSYYLKKDGPQISSSKLRKKLIKEGIKENKCEKCDQEPIWNDEPLTMQLDHIDGDGDNNTEDNLRLLCPNCHTQTPTHSAIKTERPRCKCGAKIKPKSECCRRCANKNRGKSLEKIDWPNNLPELVTQSSQLQVARVLGVSDKAVEKRLRNHHGSIAQSW